ncbi:MAG: UPF0280 family protein [Burkholderiaceae bacterium]|nr:UPF0280 family protein [Burkholderiaceae bacterium]
MGPVRAQLAPRRWHFQHGPIDLIIGAHGDDGAVHEAFEHAWARFQNVLPELVGELALLRQPVNTNCALRGTVAQRMWRACAPFAPEFITPMAAVAGSVAQEILASFEQDGVCRAWVNNGGDIALHLQAGEQAVLAVCADPAAVASPADRVVIEADSAVRGVATSGWRGRSFSLGIADAVTVLAREAAQADAAATMIANQVDCDDEAIERRPACELKDDSDLGDQPVTVRVGSLSLAKTQQALERGARFAQALIARDLITQAMLSLQGRSRIVVPSKQRLS